MRTLSGPFDGRSAGGHWADLDRAGIKAAASVPVPAICWSWRLHAEADESTAVASALAVACRRTAKMARLEAVLLVADVPLSPRRLAQWATLADATEARTLINRLNAAFEQTATPFRVERVAAGYRLFPLPPVAFWLAN